MTSWQDIVLTIGSALCSYCLIPQIAYNYKKKICEFSYQTLVITAISMTYFLFVYYTLGLVLTEITVTVAASCWWVLLFQKYYYEKGKNR